MAFVEIAAEQRVVLGARLRRQVLADQVAIAREHAPETARRPEVVDADADGDAGAAGLAGGPIGDALRAPEAALREHVVEVARSPANKSCDADQARTTTSPVRMSWPSLRSSRTNPQRISSTQSATVPAAT